jgi:hypothetical protein
LLKFDRREGFHQPPLTYNTQIMVYPVFFYPAKMTSVGFYFNSLILCTHIGVKLQMQAGIYLMGRSSWLR